MSLTAIQACDVIVLAVKPQQLPTLAAQLSPLLAQQLIISIAAGIRLTDLSRWLGDYKTIIRCMPNTPAPNSSRHHWIVCDARGHT